MPLLAFLLAAAAKPFTFVALGDQPYGQKADVYPPFEALIGAINEAGPDFVLHIGDTKSGGVPCDDETQDEALAFFGDFESALIYTPGDNEWTDCHRSSAGGYVPTERLARIRDTYFADPGRSLGRAPIALNSQAADGYPENARFIKEGVMVVTAHVVGSNNGFEPRSPAAVEEHLGRDAANVRWITSSFEQAANAGVAAVVVGIHADMFEFNFGPRWAPEGWLSSSGHRAFGEALVAGAAGFEKPVLLIFGDSHTFRVFRPFPLSAPNLTALEVFGASDMHAVEVTVDPDTLGIFAYRPLMNPGPVSGAGR